MATATITRLSPTMPTQGSYDYLYQADLGLHNLHSVWAHGPRGAGKENGPTSRRAKPPSSCEPHARRSDSGWDAVADTQHGVVYDPSSPYAANFLAIGLEYRLACALGRKTIRLQDRSVDSPASRKLGMPRYNHLVMNILLISRARRPLELRGAREG